MQLDDWQEQRYTQIFEDTCHFIRLQRHTNPDFSVDDLERLLQTAYIRTGNDWIGRGAAADIVNSATIAAYEHMLAEWRRE